jgi:chromosome segregation ATPase
VRVKSLEGRNDELRLQLQDALN